MEEPHPTEPEQYELLLVVHAAISMHNFLSSLNTSLRQIISISMLTGCFSRIAMAASLKCEGGGGFLEAAKVALAKANEAPTKSCDRMPKH
ncbi:hypothetical protein BBP40_011170 [Aspergillus hancockii]|nr:hypothetical protein BBP40_011170 [Aspergillus hancockii]